MRGISLYVLIVCCLASTAWAQEHFEKDRVFAEQHLRPEHRQYCLQDFSQRIKTTVPVEIDGAFAFNDYISRDVYHMLYWKDGARGVAFTVPVRLKDPRRGEVSTNVACFYAVREDDLVFQYSQQLTWKL